MCLNWNVLTVCESVYFIYIAITLPRHTSILSLFVEEMMLSKGLWPILVGSRSEQRLLLSSFVYSLIWNACNAMRECMDIVSHESCVCVCVLCERVCVLCSDTFACLNDMTRHTAKTHKKRSAKYKRIYIYACLLHWTAVAAVLFSVQHTQLAFSLEYALAIRTREQAQTHDFDYTVIAFWKCFRSLASCFDACMCVPSAYYYFHYTLCHALISYNTRSVIYLFFLF